jgi:hypothetical protein
MGGRVPVRGVVTTADLPAALAHPKVHPAAADLQAFLAACDRHRQLGDGDLVEVRARDIHSETIDAPRVSRRRMA